MSLRNLLEIGRKRLVCDCQPHPTNSRSKCLTLEQVEQLANLHGRILQLDLLGTLPLIEMNDFDERDTENTAQFLQEEAELRQILFQLEKTVENQQWQIAQLALILLLEPTQRNQQQQEILKGLIKIVGEENLLENLILTERAMHPAEMRAREHEIPQVIYDVDTYTYFIIRPGEGETSQSHQIPLNGLIGWRRSLLFAL